MLYLLKLAHRLSIIYYIVIRVVWNTKCQVNKEFIFCSRNFVTVYMNNDIPKALVFNAFTPTWVSF